jgi:uncharacterized protein (TIGR02996 family)
MDDDAPFLAAVAAAPGEWAPRLIYADWLEERGDGRAELIRLHARLEAEGETLPDAEFLDLLAREKRLRYGVPARWIERLGFDDAYVRWLRLEEGLRLDDGRVRLQWGMTADALARCGEPVRTPLPHGRSERFTWHGCSFWRGMTGSVDAVLASPSKGEPAALTSLTLQQTPPERSAGQESPLCDRWRELTLRFGPPTEQFRIRDYRRLPQPVVRSIWQFASIGLEFEYLEIDALCNTLRIFHRPAAATS